MIRFAATTVLAAGLLSGTAFAQDAIKIGASLPLTGNFSVTGIKHEEGYQLCVDLINEKGGIMNRSVELIVSDNRSDTATALNQYERFINVDKVDVVFGTFSSRLTFPISSVLSKYDFVHPIPAGGALRIYTQGFDNQFYFQQNAAEYVGTTLQRVIEDLVAADQKPTKAALVHADDFFANAIRAGFLGEVVKSPGGDDVANLAPGNLADLGIEVVYQEKWPEEGFSDWLNLANSIKRSGADVIIGLTASAEEAVQLARGLKTVRVQPKLVYLSQGTQSEFLEGLGKDSDGIMMHAAWHEQVSFVGTLAGKEFTNQDFLAAYKDKHGRTADEDSAIPFALCQGMEQAILGAGSTDNAAMKAWLNARTKDDPVRTVLGPFAWDERGLPLERPFLMAQWQNGELKFIYPTDEFKGVTPILHPKPEW